MHEVRAAQAAASNFPPSTNWIADSRAIYHVHTDAAAALDRRMTWYMYKVQALHLLECSQLCFNGALLAQHSVPMPTESICELQNVCLQQLLVSPEELDAIVARLATQPSTKAKKGREGTQMKAVKLVYQKDAAKGYKEVYTPVKQARLLLFQKRLMHANFTYMPNSKADCHCKLMAAAP